MPRNRRTGDETMTLCQSAKTEYYVRNTKVETRAPGLFEIPAASAGISDRQQRWFKNRTETGRPA